MADPVWTKLGPVATGGASSAGTITVTLNRDQDAGTILVIDAEGNGATFATVTDSRGGNTYQADLAAIGHNRCTFSSSGKPSNLLKSGDVVTVTFSGSVTDRNMVVYQVTNLDQTTWVAGSANSNGTSTAPDSGNVTGLTSGNSYAVHGVCGYSNGGGAYTAGTDGHSGTLTGLDSLSSGSAFRMATEAGLAVTGQTTFKATGTVTSTSWVQGVVVYNIAAGATAKSATDSGSGSDALTETAAASAPDAGAGTEALTASAATTTTDAGSGSEALAETTTGSIADTGAGADTAAQALAAALTDTGAGSEAQTLSAALPGADAGAGTDPVALAAAAALTDTAAGTEALALTAPFALADPGTGDDLADVRVFLTLADAGAGVDVTHELAALALSDAGSGADTADAVASQDVLLTVTDGGTGTDGARVLAGVGATDTGHGTDGLRRRAEGKPGPAGRITAPDRPRVGAARW